MFAAAERSEALDPLLVVGHGAVALPAHRSLLVVPQDVAVVVVVELLGVERQQTVVGHTRDADAVLDPPHLGPDELVPLATPHAATLRAAPPEHGPSTGDSTPRHGLLVTT